MTLKKMITGDGAPLVLFTPDDLRRLFDHELPEEFMRVVEELAEASIPYSDPSGGIILDRAGFLGLCYQIATGKLPPA